MKKGSGAFDAENHQNEGVIVRLHHVPNTQTLPFFGSIAIIPGTGVAVPTTLNQAFSTSVWFPGLTSLKPRRKRSTDRGRPDDGPPQRKDKAR